MSIWNEVAKGFSEKGPNYWQWFGQALMDQSSLKEGQAFLDVGFGRGASLFPGLEKVGARGKAYGIDTSDQMVFYTQKACQDQENVHLSCSNLEGFDCDQDLDGIYCGFGLGFIEMEKAYGKIKTLLRDQGEFGVCNWTHQEDQDWMTGLVNRFLDIEEDIKPPHPISFEEGLVALFEREGFKNIRSQVITKTFYFKDKEEWWQDLNQTAVKNTLKAVEDKGRLEAFKAQAFEDLEAQMTPDGLAVKRQAILAYGQISK